MVSFFTLVAVGLVGVAAASEDGFGPRGPAHTGVFSFPSGFDEMIDCEQPDTATATNRCNGTEYDFSKIVPAGAGSYFGAENTADQTMSFFQMTKGGLGEDTRCSYPAGVNATGVVGAVGGIDGIPERTCTAYGKLSKQTWKLNRQETLFNGTNISQAITIQFEGETGADATGDTLLTVYCDPKATAPVMAVFSVTDGNLNVEMVSNAACPGAAPSTPSKKSFIQENAAAVGAGIAVFVILLLIVIGTSRSNKKAKYDSIDGDTYAAH